MPATNLTCTRRLDFCAGHRVMGHDGKCSHLHGHNYTVEITARAERLDRLGMVVDFGVIKNLLGTWIAKNWDHGFILNSRDTAAIEAVAPFVFKQGRKVHHQRVYLLDGNPTAEVMAHGLLHTICPHVFRDTNVEVSAVKLWETPNSWAYVEKSAR